MRDLCSKVAVAASRGIPVVSWSVHSHFLACAQNCPPVAAKIASNLNQSFSNLDQQPRPKHHLWSGPFRPQLSSINFVGPDFTPLRKAQSQATRCRSPQRYELPQPHVLLQLLDSSSPLLSSPQQLQTSPTMPIPHGMRQTLAMQATVRLCLLALLRTAHLSRPLGLQLAWPHGFLGDLPLLTCPVFHYRISSSSSVMPPVSDHPLFPLETSPIDTPLIYR